MAEKKSEDALRHKDASAPQKDADPQEAVSKRDGDAKYAPFSTAHLCAAEERTMARLERGESVCWQASEGSRDLKTTGWHVCYKYPARCYYCA